MSCQMRYEIITDGGVFGAGAFDRPPRVIGNPNTSKNPGLTAYATVFKGVPSVRRSVTSLGCRPATRAIERLGSFSRTTSTGDNRPEVTRPSVSVVRRE